MSDNASPAAGSLTPSAVAPSAEQSPSASAGGGLMAVIERLATNPNINMEVFDRLLAARRQEEDREAERQFNAAISRAKGEMPPVFKSNQVDFTGKSGVRTRYTHEAFSDVARVVDPVFAKFGLAYRFSIAQDGDVVKVTCVVSHANGFTERTTLEGKIDATAGMNTIQALGSILTYLQRYSLRAAIGLAAAKDDDGRGAQGAERINRNQAQDLARLIEETGRSQVTLLKLLGVDRVEDMNADQAQRAREVLELAMAERRKHAPGQ